MKVVNPEGGVEALCPGLWDRMKPTNYDRG